MPLLIDAMPPGIAIHGGDEGGLAGNPGRIEPSATPPTASTGSRQEAAGNNINMLASHREGTAKRRTVVHRSAGILILSGVLVVSCATTETPSPSPSAVTRSASPSIASATPLIPSATPSFPSTPAPQTTLSPTAGGWPLIGALSGPVFGPEGTVYLLIGERDAQGEDQQSLVALDAAGFVKSGWPIEQRPGSEFGSLAVGPDGFVYVEECGASNVGCLLHRLGIDGRELPGWPFEVPPASCSTSAPCGLVVGSDGTAYLTSGYQKGDQTQIIAIDAAGRTKPGWPVALDHKHWSWSDPKLGTDGTVFILSRFNGTESPTALSLWAFASDGSPRPGWPVSVPDMVGYLLGPHGTVVVWSSIDLVEEGCPQPSRTVFTVLGPNGQSLPGWPRESTGYASSPVVRADGTVYYVSALGKVYAHDRAGAIKVGWPVEVPGAITSSGCGPAPPYLAPDGTIYVLGDEVIARSPDGQLRPGWPYNPAGLLYLYTRDELNSALRPAPAYDPDGTVYIAVFGRDDIQDVTDIVALDRQGRLKPGWPYRLLIDVSPNGNGDLLLAVSPEGRLFVDVVNCCAPGRVHLALDPDGRISD